MPWSVHFREVALGQKIKHCMKPGCSFPPKPGSICTILCKMHCTFDAHLFGAISAQRKIGKFLKEQEIEKVILEGGVSALLYVGLGLVAVGMVITFVGLGDKVGH